MAHEFNGLKPRYGVVSAYQDHWGKPDPNLPKLDSVDRPFAKVIQDEFMKASARAFDSSLRTFMIENDLTFEEMFAEPRAANRVTWIRALIRAIAESSEDEGAIYFLATWMNAIDFKQRRRKVAGR